MRTLRKYLARFLTWFAWYIAWLAFLLDRTEAQNTAFAEWVQCVACFEKETSTEDFL